MCDSVIIIFLTKSAAPSATVILSGEGRAAARSAIPVAKEGGRDMRGPKATGMPP